jgi:hypothetical protein
MSDDFVIANRPVIPGFHPDPSICRVGDEFFLINSSFEYFPGVPIWRSTDLRAWTQLGHVLDRVEQLPIDGVTSSAGIYAPTLRHHDNQFWMITTNVSDGDGQILVVSSTSSGPWSKPVRVTDARGIDPDLAWDEDGNCWLSWSGHQPLGRLGILQARLDTQSGSLLSEPRVIWRGAWGQSPEGPHLFRRGAFWYLLVAEGGTERGHAVTVARGPRPDGPFETSPFNPVLTARSTALPVQNVGHADLVERADGSWAMFFLGVRPRGWTPSWHVLGRETFACEVDWVDDWPRPGAPIEPHENTDFTEVLGAVGLPPSWVAASHELLLHRKDSCWELDAELGAEHFVGRRQQHFFTETRSRLRSSAHRAGLEIRIDPRHRFGVYVTDDRVVAIATIGGIAVQMASVHLTDDIELIVRTTPSSAPMGPEHGPDEISAGIMTRSEYLELGILDGRYISTEVASGFTGRMIGISAVGGTVGIASFSYSERQP